MFATSVTVLGPVAACSSSDDSSNEADGSIGYLYGGPPFEPEAGPKDDGGISTHYGLPSDAGIFDDATVADSGDAGEDAD